jgi:hypothetical protein
VASEVLTGTVDISVYTPYKDDIFADDVLFNIYADARLVLFGDDLFSNDTIAMTGQLRNRGNLVIGDGLTLQGAAMFVNTETVTQNGGSLTGGGSVRNIASATPALSSPSQTPALK